MVGVSERQPSGRLEVGQFAQLIVSVALQRAQLVQVLRVQLVELPIVRQIQLNQSRLDGQKGARFNLLETIVLELEDL